MEAFEPLGPDHVRADAMNDAMRGEHFADRRFAALVPYLVEPPPDERLVFHVPTSPSIARRSPGWALAIVANARRGVMREAMRGDP